MAKISSLTGVQLPANSMLDVQVGPGPAIHVKCRCLHAEVHCIYCRDCWQHASYSAAWSNACRCLQASSDEWAQVKRIHEYKRQFMNVLGVIHRYHTIKSMDASERSKVRAWALQGWPLCSLMP